MDIKKLMLGRHCRRRRAGRHGWLGFGLCACNRYGDCWHTTGRYDYRPAFGVTVHDDNWRWGHRDRYRWREHAGRGYWRSGVWVTF